MKKKELGIVAVGASEKLSEFQNIPEIKGKLKMSTNQAVKAFSDSLKLVSMSVIGKG